MLVKAEKTFAGKTLCMRKNDVKELPAGAALSDLLRCGYVSEVKNVEDKRSEPRGRKKSSSGGL